MEQVYIFTYGDPVVQVQFVEKTAFFSTELSLHLF